MPGKKPKHSFNEKRRKLLRIIGLGTAITAAQSVTGQVRPQRDTLRRPTQPTNRPDLEITSQPRPQVRFITIKLLRPFDLLSLDLRYYNCTINNGKIVKRGDPAYLAVVFQPQTISEQAWNETSNGMESPTVPGKLLISGESRIVFKIPSTVNNIPLDVKELLDWDKYELMVNGRAKQPAGNNIVIPPSGRFKIIGDKLNARVVSRTNTKARKRTSPARGMTKEERKAANNMLITQTMNSRADAIVNVRENLTMLAQAPVGPPAELETSLEVPLRLYLSPTKLAGWNHLTKADPDNGIIKQTNKLFELWHTRMGTKTSQGIDESDLTIEQRIVRALWADDAKVDYKEAVIEKTLDNFLGVTSMTNKDRHQIVHESSNFQIPNFVPPPIKAYKLFLSTLGAWLDSELVVERKKLETAGVLYGASNSLNLLKWRHIETMAREHYVEIVKAGNIMPFGHEAVLIKITERKPHTPTGTAANFQRKIVVITEPVKEYNYRTGNTFMNFCFSKVEMVTTVSPLLDVNKKKLSQAPLPGAPPPTPNEPPKVAGDEQFVIMADNKEVQFKVKAEDLDGNLVDFTIPLAFVSTDVLGSNSYVDSLVAAYNSGTRMANRTQFNGQKFTLAPQADNGADTAFAAKGVQFKTMAYRTADEPQGFMPVLGEADIIEPSYQRLVGSNDTVKVSLEDDNNKGNVFARVMSSKSMNFAGNTDKTGGLAAPNFNMSGLSKAAGAFGGAVDSFKNGAAKAEEVFNTVNSLPDAKLFGVFKLTELLDLVAGNNDSYSLAKPLAERLASKIPNLVTEETASAYITSYVIKPKLKTIGNGFVRFKPDNPDNAFSIVTQVKAYKNNPTSPEFSTDAWLRGFSVGVVQIDGNEYLVNINFKEIRFLMELGKKADISVDMKDQCVTFGGPLRFVNQVTKLIDPKGFYDPPYVDVTLAGIKCGYTLAIPNLQMGAFTLSNITLGAEVNLPFTGGPLTFAFRFCERQQPFCLTVSCLGGGGFFGLELDLNGLRQIEAALEFGAAVSINLGVASGSVSIMAGIYFKMEFTDGQNNTQLTGYVRINGSVSVLGLITASLELYLALTWLIDKKKAYGEATLKIKVEVLFFSATVTVKAKKTFAGSGDDPNFRMCLTNGDWEEYCSAFAA